MGRCDAFLVMLVVQIKLVIKFCLFIWRKIYEKQNIFFIIKISWADADELEKVKAENEKLVSIIRESNVYSTRKVC